MASILTLGHSAHSWKSFLHLVDSAAIRIVADVRSNPRSRFSWFNRDFLAQGLERASIRYVFLGNELGGRWSLPYPVDYEHLAQQPAFQEGIAALEALAEQGRVACVCSEHSPVECHRGLLIGRVLHERGHDVRHILRDGRLIDHHEFEGDLLVLTKQSDDDLLTDRQERLATAYRAQNHRLARRTR